jgi:hypothetical protein
MYYPELLIPHDKEVISLPSGRDVEIPKTKPFFEGWSGEPISDRYGNKGVISFRPPVPRRGITL